MAAIGERMVVSSLNCRGLQTATNMKDVLNYLKQKDFHINCLQDIHWTQNNF